MILVMKASSDYWYSFETETDVIKLKQKYGNFVFRTNYNNNASVEDLIRFWEGLTIADAEKISKCEYTLLIYDSYIE